MIVYQSIAEVVAVRMKDIADEFDLPRTDVENWIARGLMRTNYAATVRGRSREFTKENVLELAATRAFVSVGCNVSDAVLLAEIIVDNWRGRKAQKKWLVAPAKLSLIHI